MKGQGNEKNPHLLRWDTPYFAGIPCRDRYSATVPLTPEGILYYFEAIDSDGNAANYPDFMKQTPYFVIEAWNSGENISDLTAGEP